MKKLNYTYYFSVILLVILVWWSLKLMFKKNIPNEMMYNHMELSSMMWNSNNLFNMWISLLVMVLLIFMVSKSNMYLSRWNIISDKVFNTNFNFNDYMIVSSISSIILIYNMYSLFSFLWVPSTQNWFMLTITCMFLLSIWVNVIFKGGLKIFGEKIPLSWYVLNFLLWLFHNLSFMIRFISLPFRMMMNLIVGAFLIDFSKFLSPVVSFVSIYEIFVMMVQTTVFIILANMYYAEMVILPEWASHKSSYPFNFNIKLVIWLKLIKTLMMLIFKKLNKH